jgi:putative hydrolase of the HAD superfamily
MAISAILLDYGGTLDADGVHWLDRFYALYERLAAPPPSRPAIKQAFYAGTRAIEQDPTIRSCGMRELVRRHVVVQVDALGWPDRGLAAQVADAFADPIDDLFLRNREILADLRRQDFRLGIVSNFYGNLLTICDEAGFTPLLDVILDSGVVGLRKPDPQFFATALDRLHVPADHAAFVGDSLDQDMRPAKALGMTTVWLRDDGEAPCTEAGLVDVTIRSLTELPTLAAGWRVCPPSLHFGEASP